LWQDVIAAGVAVFSYSVFFSTPLNLLPWPVPVGMLPTLYGGGRSRYLVPASRPTPSSLVSSSG
jgi:hypothetical protein